MAVPWTAPELASRFAPYIEELQEFFASYGMHYGSAEDLHALIGLVDDDAPFAEDLSSMVRSIVLREGGSVPRADLLEIVAVAISGPNVDQAGQELQQSVRYLLIFLDGVLSKPWNEPPSIPSPQPPKKPLEFPAPKVEPAFVRPESIYSKFDQARPDPEASARLAYVPELRVEFTRDYESGPADDVEAFPVPGSLPPSALDTGPPSPPVSPSMLSALAAGAGALLVAGLLVVALHSRFASQTESQPVITAVAASSNPPAPVVPAPATPATAAVAVSVSVAASQPTPEVPAIAARPHSRHADDIIADPYFTPIPGQSSPAVSTPAQQSAASQPAPGSTTPSPNAIIRPATRPIDPDSTYVGASAEDQAATAASYLDPSSLARRSSEPAGFRSAASREDFPTVSSGMMAGNLISAPLPGYPRMAKIAHIHGEVILQAVISQDGSVSATHVLSGNRLLRGAAVDAVRRWRYRPYMLDGRPVDVSTIVTVDFHNPRE